MATVISHLQPAWFAEFERETSNGNVVAVVKTLPRQPVSAVEGFMRLAPQSAYAFLFESVEGREGVAQYSFIGSDPYMLVRGRGNKTLIQKSGSVEIRRERAVEYLRRHFRGRKLAKRSDVGPLAGGAVGYLGYRAANWFEPALNLNGESASTTDDAVMMIYRTLVIFDRVAQHTKIVPCFCGRSRRSNQSARALRQRRARDGAH